MVKKTLALILTVLLALAFTCPVFAETTIEHPKVIVYGDVTKTVYPGRSIFEYKDDQGLSSVLPFERQDQNITINFANIVFEKNFENKSIADATASETSTAFTVTKELLQESGQEYLYLKMVNSSNLETNKDYAITYRLDGPEKTVTNNDYLFATMKLHKTGSNLQVARGYIFFIFKDAGAIKRAISIGIDLFTGVYEQGTATYLYTGESVDIIRYIKGNVADSTWITLQFRIQDLLDGVSANWNLVKLIGMAFRWILRTGATLDSQIALEFYVRHALLSSSKIYIDDPTYTNGLVVNGTSGSITPSAGDAIQVYGANATKITSVTIPWQWEITPEIETDAENLQMQYTWTFTMPQSPTSAEADSLTFSNTNITLYGYKDGDAWDRLYLNGVDKLSSIASKKVDETTTGYWSYELASSLTEGNIYQIIARITYTADEYDALTEAPVFWTNPVAWIQYKFWELVIAIASFLGLGTAWAVRQKRKLRTPKR